MKFEQFYTLHTMPENGGPFNNRSPFEWQLEGKDIHCNDVVFPNEYNPHNCRLWLVCNEFGALFAVWGNHAQEALDNACDLNLMESFLANVSGYDDVEHMYENATHLGNAGELHDLTYCQLLRVRLDVEKDCLLMMALAYAQGAGLDKLEE